MNTLEKIWCRSFQKTMRTAIPLLPYRKPEILHSVEQIPEKMKESGCRQALLVTDRSIRLHGLTRRLEQALAGEGIGVSVFETIANPTTDVIEETVSLYRRTRCDTLIGFGGGSSMDTAKAVGALVVNPRKTLASMSGILKVRKKLPPLYAVPTTAGTGSETTLAAVVTDAKTRHKYPISDFPLIPMYAVLDPEVTRTLPPDLTATTGMDALTHAVEAYIGQSTTAETEREALTAVRLIFRYLEQAYLNGDDLSARKQMLLAAFLAGDAFSKSYVGYVHAVAHSLGGKYNTPHGLANAVILPYVLEAYGSAIHKKLKKLAVAARIARESDPEARAAAAFIFAVREMNRKMNIPETLPCIRRKDIPELAAFANAEANPLYPVPVLMDTKELERFYELVRRPARRSETAEKDKASGKGAEGGNKNTRKEGAA